MYIQHNLMSMRTLRERNKTNTALSKSMKKLSSGFRINSAADDASGLCVSERMRAKLTELNRCKENVKEGIDLANTADAALEEVNTMLRRAYSLCIEAKNGTFGKMERASISDEINELFAEIDRITAGTNYNSISLFRGDTNEIELEYRTEYDETYTTLMPGTLEEWGAMTFINTESFPRAPQATPATATFRLDDSIDFDDVNTLEGKTIQIGSNSYLFSSTPSSYYNLMQNTDTKIIDLKRYNTTEKALKALAESSILHYASYTPDVEEVTIDKAERTVTLTAKCIPLKDPVEADGKVVEYVVENGNGESKNGLKVQNTFGNDIIFQVDGLGATNNQPHYSDTVAGTFKLSGLPAELTQDDVDALNENTLHMGSATIALKDLNFKVGMTKNEVGNAIAAAINAKSAGTINYNASYDDAEGLSVKIRNTAWTGAVYVPSYESTTPSTQVNGTSWNSAALDIKVETQVATMETPEVSTITIPKNLNAPFSFSLGGRTYLCYDSSKDKLTYDDFTSTSYSPSYPTPIRYDTNGKSSDDIQKDILDYIENYLSSNPNVDFEHVARSENKLTVPGKNPKQNLNLDNLIYGTPLKVTPYKSEGGGTYVLGSYGNLSGNLYQDVDVSFSLGSSFDKDKLIGSGFSIANSRYYSYDTKRFEFTNGSTDQRGDYTDIDISGCNSFSELADAMEKVIGNCKVTIDEGTGELTIAMQRDADSGYEIYVTDGAEGIMADGPLTFSGGTNVGYSQIELDFSSINSDNLETLLGQGFRINCATCEGEYINVFFCWENDGTVPATFDRFDEETKENRTIHNIPVELSKITSGDKIVEDIVKQVRPSLKHYTDVLVGEPPTILIAREKRIGDVTDEKGKLYLGKVQTGVEANFTYKVDIRKEPILPDDDDSVNINFRIHELNIYAGSDPEAQLIPIHLPYLDLVSMNLNPPELVDLNDPEQDASDWSDRINIANISISSARGTIGADYNRLEHTYNQLSNYEENLTEAESVIRDTDYAQEVMKQVRLQILTQSQQAMLSQANTMPQMVLQLLQ